MTSNYESLSAIAWDEVDPMEMPVVEVIMQSDRDSAPETDLGRWRNVSLENAGICGRYDFWTSDTCQSP